ncbi:PrsW family glutamic-type intramembrane protease [Thermococcus sp. 21S7]|uniref:PrsW family glutamic-type intramembrane protease n=1 Tax=Thermococcus sp. 21S7 TaxID=1638221 RepID=UPI00143B8516|nr:PrsW family glutamic-type intramembrane protease [Thermococcus sp. 21S7]NJE60744.1 PrsW family intramembrane metalloprotease [Thermococcus sp. 21S7]
MLTPEKVIEYYFGIITVVGGLSVLLAVKYTLRRWRSFPKNGWKVGSFATALVGLIVASLLETPLLFLKTWIALAFAAGIIEESVKLLPMKFFERSPEWEKWRLVIGAGLFLGIIEGLMYTAGIFALNQPAYLVGVRIVLAGLHATWAAITIGFLLGERGWKRFTGLAFSMIAHALYDLPSLAMVDGYPGTVVAYLAGLSTGFLLVTPLMAKKAAEMAGRLVPEEGEGQDEVPENIEETEENEVTSSP